MKGHFTFPKVPEKKPTVRFSLEYYFCLIYRWEPKKHCPFIKGRTESNVNEGVLVGVGRVYSSVRKLLVCTTAPADLAQK